MTTQELFAYIEREYGVTPDYPWLDSPEGAVFRHADNRKWFALAMPIPRRYAYPGEIGEVDAVNLKCDPVLSAMLRHEPGILPAYHMSKVHGSPSCWTAPQTTTGSSFCCSIASS